MPKDEVVAGTTSRIFEIFVQNSGATNGAGLAGLVFNSAGLVAYYKRNTANAAVAMTLANASTLGTFTANGFGVVDGTNMAGVYEFDPPNAAFAAGAQSVVFMVAGATNMAPVVFEVAIKGVDTQDAVHMGIGALPNTNCAGNASLITNGSANTQLAAVNGTVSALINTMAALNAMCNANATAPSELDGFSPTNASLTTFATNAALPPANFANLAIDANGAVTVSSVTDKTGYSLAAGQLTIKKNTAFNNFPFVMLDSNTGLPAANFTVTGQRKIDAGTFAGFANTTVTDDGNGWYRINFAAGDTNGSAIAVMFTATGAKPTNITLLTQA